MGVDLNDFIWKERANSKKKDKLYRCTCKTCGIDRGYKGKSDTNKDCLPCRSKNTFKKRAVSDDNIQTNGDGGRRKYKIICPKCGLDRGYKRLRDKDRICVLCANIERRNIAQQNKQQKMLDCNLTLCELNAIDQLKEEIRSMARKSLRRKIGHAFIDDLGCSVDELKAHLASKFQEGMTWENHGLYGWHIDHILPLSIFDLTDPEQFKKACHYTNLQPLWAKDNLVKSNKILNNKEETHEQQ